jgi:hypothetical protein
VGANGDRPLRDDRDRGIFLEAGQETAALGVEIGPEAEIVVAEVEDIGRPSFDEHFRLGNRDVVGVARSEF